MRLYLPSSILLGACLLGIRPAAAQDSLYRALRAEPSGHQLLAIYIGAYDCQPCVWPAFKADLRRMWPLLARQATEAGLAFATMGVAISADVDSGAAMLAPLSQFDEVSIGGGWINQTAERYIWSDSTGEAMVPQVLVVRRDVNASNAKTLWSVSPYTVVFRMSGAQPLRAWVSQGAPLRLAPGAP